MDELDAARKARDGLEGFEDPNLLPVIFEPSGAHEWDSEEAFAEANPHYPVTPTRRYYRQKVRKAIRSIPFRNQYKRLNLNLITAQETAFLKMEDWDACGEKVEVSGGDRAVLAFDLGETQDLTAAVLLFPDRQNAVRAHFWVPEKTVQERREAKKRPDYDVWIRSGLMTVTPGNATDYDFVEKWILEQLASLRRSSAGWPATSRASECPTTSGSSTARPAGGFSSPRPTSTRRC